MARTLIGANDAGSDRSAVRAQVVSPPMGKSQPDNTTNRSNLGIALRTISVGTKSTDSTSALRPK